MNDHDSAVDVILIDRYLARECTLAERRLVEQWAAADPSHQKQLARASAIQEKTRRPIKAKDSQSAWRSVAQEVTGRPRREPPVDRWPTRMRPTFSRWSMFAAGFVMMLGAGWLAIAQHRANNAGAGPALQFATDVAERRTVRLIDGTEVTLAPESQLTMARDYGRHERAITLEGEAYFVVVHNADRPFSVRTKQAVMRDIGTAFDVKAYAGDVGARVAVTEGRVAVAEVRCAVGHQTPPCSAMMQKGDVAFVDNTGVSMTHISDIDSYAAWMQGRLVFDETPLHDVIKDLERNFGLKITIVDSSLSNEHVSGNFNNVPVDQVLEEITRTAGAQYEHRGRVVTITRKPAVRARQTEKSPTPLSTALKSE